MVKLLKYYWQMCQLLPNGLSLKTGFLKVFTSNIFGKNSKSLWTYHISSGKNLKERNESSFCFILNKYNSVSLN